VRESINLIPQNFRLNRDVELVCFGPNMIFLSLLFPTYAFLSHTPYYYYYYFL